MSQPPYPPPSPPPGPQQYAPPQGYDPAYPAQPTGPMDWVPGFPPPEGHPSAPVDAHPAPAVGPSIRTPADRAALTGTVLGALGLVVLELAQTARSVAPLEAALDLALDGIRAHLGPGSAAVVDGHVPVGPSSRPGG